MEISVIFWILKTLKRDRKLLNPSWNQRFFLKNIPSSKIIGHNNVQQELKSVWNVKQDLDNTRAWFERSGTDFEPVFFSAISISPITPYGWLFKAIVISLAIIGTLYIVTRPTSK